jgi:hypothetical protein
MRGTNDPLARELSFQLFQDEEKGEYNIVLIMIY